MLVTRFYAQSLSVWTGLVFGLLILAVLLNKYSLEYRLRNGFYGTTEYEARELIELILKHADKSDFSDGSGLKELVAEPRRTTDGIRDLVPSLDS